MAALKAVFDTLSSLRNGQSPEALDGIAAPELMQRVMRDRQYQQWLKDWL
jgi:hypothetical protein